MTRSSKHQNFINCSLDSGKKGTLVIRKTNRSFRRHRAANIAAANAAKKKEVEEVMSDLTPQTTYTRSWFSTARSKNESNKGNARWHREGSQRRCDITYFEYRNMA